LWEPPFNLDEDGPRRQRQKEDATRLGELLEAGAGAMPSSTS
jgi:hypothetical protein